MNSPKAMWVRMFDRGGRHDPSGPLLTTQLVDTLSEAPGVVNLTGLITAVCTPPYGRTEDYHGGPGASAIDRFDVIDNVPVNVEDQQREEIGNLHPVERMDEQAKRDQSDSLWFTVESPWRDFAMTWNATSIPERAVALAAFKGWDVPEPDEPCPGCGNVHHDGVGTSVVKMTGNESLVEVVQKVTQGLREAMEGSLGPLPKEFLETMPEELKEIFGFDPNDPV